MAEERLQKILANAGVASRRKAEELILAGRVSVNGRTITELGSKADIGADQVKVDGRVLSAPTHRVYIVLNKPKNCVTTVHDPEGRETVMKFFKGFPERIYPVGRLDYASEGLLLLTNDGDFANKLMSPSSNISKTYLAKVTGILTTEQEEQFRQGIPMHGRKTAPAGLRIIRKSLNPWYEVRLVEGRQNQIRIMFKHLGFLVEKLKRVKIGFLELGNLKPGAYRTLTNAEVARFTKLLSAEPLERGKTRERHVDDERFGNEKTTSGSEDHRRGGAKQQPDKAEFRRVPVSAKARVSHHSGKPQRKGKGSVGRAGVRDRK